MARTIYIDGPAHGHEHDGHPVSSCVKWIVPDLCDRVWWRDDELPEPRMAIGCTLVHYWLDGETPEGTRIYVYREAFNRPAVVDG